MSARARLAALLVAATVLAWTAAGSTNDSAWIGDLDYLARELPKRHANAFASVSKETFDAEVRKLRDQIPSIADHEVVAGMMRLVAMLGDAHTRLVATSLGSFPIRTLWLSDGLFVIRSDQQNADLIGTRIEAIDVHPISEVTGALEQLISHENDWWVRACMPDFVTTPAFLHAMHVIPTPEAASFRFRRSDGTTFDRTLTSVPASSIQVDPLSEGDKPLYLRNLEKYYWYDYDESSQTLYVQYNRCRNDPGNPVDAFGRELAAVARSHSVWRLVLDLRLNGGGDSSLIRPLLEELYSAAPDLDAPNRFWVVIGPQTFSSAMANALQIDQQTRATLIGEPTGGKPNSFGNVQSFQLPISRLTVRHTTRFFTFMPGSDPPAVMPEVWVETTSADYFSRRDPVMERILARPPRRRAVRP